VIGEIVPGAGRPSYTYSMSSKETTPQFGHLGLSEGMILNVFSFYKNLLTTPV